MNLEEALRLLNDWVVEYQKKIGMESKGLTPLEKEIMRRAWKGQTYDEMNISGYTTEYIKKQSAPKLWKLMSKLTGENVSKNSLKIVLEPVLKQRLQIEQIPHLQGTDKVEESNNHTDYNAFECNLQLKVEPEFPEGHVALDSKFYVERLPIESDCYKTIVKPGSLIRIKAPKLMGKSSLMMRILAYTASHNYKIVYLALGSVERAVLSNLDKLLRWFCQRVGRQLNLENQLDEYWNDLSTTSSCTDYFEEYLLPEIDCPLVLGLDEVDLVFPYPEVAEDFFGMLRSWHEKGKDLNIWKKLRLVVAYSTEIYIPLKINKSPFNVGRTVELLEFDQKQVMDLAGLHGLAWNETQVDELRAMVGGHPYLVRVAMYRISRQEVTLKQLLQYASTEAGIYSDHLRHHLENLQKAPQLLEAFKKVVTSHMAVELDSMQTYKLYSMGLIQKQENQVMPRCNLYQKYFCRIL